MSEWWAEASRENFELVRRLVEHEDGLINVRTNWALAFHALLFNAFVGGVALYEKVRFGQGCFDPIACGLILACLLGVGSAVAAFAGVKAAERQARETTDWWASVAQEDQLDCLPPMYLHSKRRHCVKVNASSYFLFLAGVWVIMLVLVIWAPAMSPLSPSGQ